MRIKIFYFFLTFLFGFVTAQQLVPVIIKDNFGNDHIDISCSNPLNNSLTLTANYPTLKDTNSYGVSQGTIINYPTTNATALGVKLTDNNKFLKKIDIGFQFCYFGKNYSQLVIDTNGLVTFDLTLLGGPDFINFNQSVPNPLLPNNSIFGVYQALNFDETTGNDIFYEVVGAAPNRKLVITYNSKLRNKGPQSICNNLLAKSQIILNESTNAIEVYAINKPLPCNDSGFTNAIIGIQNSSANIGYTPANRNTGVWQATNEAWVFSPNGNDITPTFIWKDSGNNVLGNSNSITITNPIKSETYTVDVVYNGCNIIDLTDNYPLTIDTNYPIAIDYTDAICTAGQTINLQSYNTKITNKPIANFKFRYFKTLAEAQSGIGIEYNTTTLNTNEIYYVRIENSNNSACFAIATLHLKLISTILINTKPDVCDGEKNNYQLTSLSSIILDPLYSGNVTYYTDSAGTNVVTTANLVTGMQFWVKFDNCNNIYGPITINVIPGPTVKQPISFKTTLCDNNNDGSELFDWLNFNTINNNIVTNDLSAIITYYASQSDAISAINQLSTVKAGQYIVYARVQSSTGKCYTIAPINMDITFNKVDAIAQTDYLCFNGTDDITIDFTDPKYFTGMLISPTSGVTISVYNSLSDADVPKNAITSDTITQNGSVVTKTYYVRFVNNGCYTIRPISITLLHPVIDAPSPYYVCDTNNDGTETINLHNYDPYIAGLQPNMVVKYYDSTGAEIQNFTVTTNGTNTVNVGLSYTLTFLNGTSCNTTYPLQFVLSPLPIVKPLISIVNNKACDNNNNGYELFDATTQESQIYSGTNNYTYDFYDSYDATTNTFSNYISNPTIIKITNNVKRTIYVKITNVNGCFSKSQIDVTYLFTNLPIVLHQDVQLEQCSLSNVINFDLTLAIPMMFVQSENTENLNNITIDYFANYDPTTEILTNPITSPYIVGRATVTVYARFLSTITGCYSVAPINLITYLSPISNNINYSYCTYTGVILKELTDGRLINVDPKATYVYNFYLDDPQVVPNPREIDQVQVFYPTNGQRIYYKVQIIANISAGCTTYGFITFTKNPDVFFTPSSFTINNICDTGNDGKEIITNLRQFEAGVLQQYPNATFTYYINFPNNKIINPDSYSYDAAISKTVDMIVSVPGNCPGKATIDIQLKPTPYFVLDRTEFYFCQYIPGLVDLFVFLKNPIPTMNIVSYVWTKPDGSTETTNNTVLLNQTQVGTYSLTITANNGCTYTNNIIVKYFPVPDVYQILVEDYTIKVLAKIIPGFNNLYSIDGINWQTSYIFSNLKPDIYNIYVKYDDGNDCSIAPLQAVVVTKYNVITPNGDGVNDKWIMGNLNIFNGQQSSIEIFDRYGKKVYEQKNDTQLEWDGYYNGRKVLTDSYWYIIKIPDGRELTGWIVVKDIN